MELAKMNKTETEKFQYEEFGSFKQLANVLYAYSFIYQSINEPFRITMPETLFNISRFLLAQIARDPPTWHISIVNILVTLAKHSEQLGELLSFHVIAIHKRTKRFTVFYFVCNTNHDSKEIHV
jgi:hypothetical protein